MPSPKGPRCPVQACVDITLLQVSDPRAWRARNRTMALPLIFNTSPTTDGTLTACLNNLFKFLLDMALSLLDEEDTNATEGLFSA